jgi:uncharacterized protein YjbI with pentapeptide repeats
MADESQLKILKQGVAAWNEWRRKDGPLVVDLSKADLEGADLEGADLEGVNLDAANLFMANLSHANLGHASLLNAKLGGAELVGANLRVANLTGADLHGATLVAANLGGATLHEATLFGASFYGADLNRAELHHALLSQADLRGANLSEANLRRANLHSAILSEVALNNANLSEAELWGTVFADVDLSVCKNLGSIDHQGPSSIDIRTLQRSGPLPVVFLRGVGLPEALIEYLPSLLNQSIQLYSCFISYSAKDEEFVRRLHADLQDKGVRCWFAPEDMKVGAKILDTLDQAIRHRDKVLLVLSEASIASGWVEDEVTKGFAEERQRGSVVLFPVRLDDAVFTTNEAWALKLRDNRNIGDFRHWKDHDAYQKTLARLLRDLRIEPA